MFLTLIAALVVTLYAYFAHNYRFWKKLNVPYLEPSLFFGNLENFVAKKCPPAGMQIGNCYATLKRRGHRFGGVYALQTPIFIPIDVGLVKRILAQDFAHFDAKNFYTNVRDQPISGNLFFIGGATWKSMRVKMTPTFTSGKMRAMLGILLECRAAMAAHLADCCARDEALDIKETAARFATDVIGSAAFGIECNSFADEDPAFRRMGRRFLDETYAQTLKNMFALNWPNAARTLRITSFAKDAEAFLADVVRTTIRHRTEHAVVKNDFLQTLTTLHDDGQITFDELVAQAFVVFLAGFETSSTTMTFVLFELAQDQDVQDRVRAEMRRVLAKDGGRITYEGLAELTYTKQVIDETLRKHPPIMTIDRKCTKDYKLDDDSTLPAGTAVVVSTYGLHHDPEHYPEPEKFDPERFSPENIGKIDQYAYLPFGEGPRLCIGQRFGVMQTKVGLIALLNDYRYTLNERTSPRLDYDFKFILTPSGDVWLDMEHVD